MPRFDGENDDWDVQAILASGRWEHNIKQITKGKRGQALLRELEAALLALPRPRLAMGALAVMHIECINDEGDLEQFPSVCTVGALAWARGKQLRVSDPEYRDDWEEEEETVDVALGMGMPKTLAEYLGQMNDLYSHENEYQRYTRMLKLVRSHITGELWPVA